MLLEGFKLLVIGMGFVFVFLLILYFTLELAAVMLAGFSLAEAKESPTNALADGADEQVAAVIAAAISQYRGR